MLNVFQSTFSRSGMKQISRICTCKTERTQQNTWIMHTIQTVMSMDSTVLFLSTKTKQENQRNEASRPCPFKKSSALSHIKYGEVSLQIEFATLPPSPQPLCEMRMKRKMEKQEKCGHRLIVHSITCRGEI